MSPLLLTLLISSTSHAEPTQHQFQPSKAVTTMATFAEAAMAKKDIPATCWYLGQMRALASQRAEPDEKQKSDRGNLIAKIDDISGRCQGDPSSQDLSAAYDEAEWKRLKIGIAQIKANQ